MSEGQFLSELMLVLLEGKILGFDQDVLDELYAKYDLPSETVPEMNEDEVLEKFDTVKTHLLEMEQTNHSVTLYAKGFGNLYTLWSLIALTPSVVQIADLAPRYAEFMEKVEIAAKQIDIQAFLQANEHTDYSNVLTYLNNSRGASTDLTPRLARLEALRAAIVN